jgi:hypothetical protein
VGRSVGRMRCKRLFVGCFLRLAVRRLGWESSRALYWELSRWISSLTYGMCRSRRRSAFGTYQGASVIIHKVFFLGYVAVCVQLYCRWLAVLRLVVAVLHYMFRPTWPSSIVYDVLLLYSWKNLLRCFCCPFLHVVTLCTFPFVFFCRVFSLVSWFLCACLPACLAFRNIKVKHRTHLKMAM